MSAGAPEIRHRWPDRLFHWLMAALVLVLLGTAFLPVLGLRFDWVPVHWISGVLLVAALLFHLHRALFVHGLGAMMPARDDLRALSGGRAADPEARYDVWQKLYHWGVAAVILTLAGTGLVMMAKIDTPLWRRDPAVLSDADWGVVYVLHGGAALLLIFLLVLHVYFAFLPEHRRALAAMALGTPVPPAGERRRP